MEHREDEFCIKIDFQRDSESPARVFRAMTGLIDAFEKIDRQLVQSIDVRISPTLLLEDIETGSLKAWLRSELEAQDDKDITNLNWKPAIGRYLVRAKYILVNFLSDKTEISDRSQLRTLQGQLLRAAEETDVKQIPAYAPLTLPDIVESIQSVGTALVPLQTGDVATYLTETDSANFNISLRLAPESLEQLITKESIANEAEMILKVKRPDYLGDAMWEFRHGTRPIAAKIVDQKWLVQFQLRGIDVRPGDALRARVMVEVEYGYDGEVVATHYAVTEVLAVVQAQETTQTTFLPSGGSKP